MSLIQTTRSETPPPRQRELESGRLVLRAVRLGSADAVAGEGGRSFMVSRAAADVEEMPSGGARRALKRVVCAVAEPAWDRRALAEALVCYGGLLESHREREAAVEAFEAALSVEPADPELMLHAARSHRKAGHGEAALSLYRRVRESGDPCLRRLSAIGEALLSQDPDSQLSGVLTDAKSSGDHEATAVALEERARLRRRAGRWGEAVEDCAGAALAYVDRRDRWRVAHSLADLLLARGDLEAAREALGAAMELAVPGDRDQTVQKLREIARAQGDEVGLRRWPASANRAAPLVSLMPRRSASPRPDSFAPVVRAWRDELSRT